MKVTSKVLDMSVAEAMHRLYEIVPPDARLDLPPEVAVEYGDPARVHRRSR